MGLAALDAFAHRQLIDLDLVQMQLERAIGHPGVAVARGLLPLVEPDTESFGESWLRPAYHRCGFLAAAGAGVGSRLPRASCVPP